MKHNHSMLMAVLIAVTFAAMLAVVSQVTGNAIAQEMGGNMTAGGNMTSNMTAGGNMTSNMTAGGNMTSNMTS
jgi:hypothetical protein